MARPPQPQPQRPGSVVVTRGVGLTEWFLIVSPSTWCASRSEPGLSSAGIAARGATLRISPPPRHLLDPEIGLDRKSERDPSRIACGALRGSIGTGKRRPTFRPPTPASGARNGAGSSFLPHLSLSLPSPPRLLPVSELCPPRTGAGALLPQRAHHPLPPSFPRKGFTPRWCRSTWTRASWCALRRRPLAFRPSAPRSSGPGRAATPSTVGTARCSGTP